MKQKISIQSKSFIILFGIALVGTYACLAIAKIVNFPGITPAINKIGKSDYKTVVYNTDQQTKISAPPLLDEDVPSVSTTGWKTYTDKTYNFSFNYPQQWKIKTPVLNGGYYVINVDPGAKYYNIKIYISNNSFFAMDNLPYLTKSIAGEQALDVQGVLYGIKHQGIYYTFDQGASMSIKPQFETMVKTVTFFN